MGKIKSGLVAAAVLAGFSGAATALDWQVYNDSGLGQRIPVNANLVMTGDGYAHAPSPSLGFTSYVLTLPNTVQINGDNFLFETRVKNPVAEGGVPASDVYLAGVGRSSGLEAAVGMMDGAWATAYAYSRAGATTHSGVSSLVQDLQNWHTIGVQTQGGVMSVLYDNVSIYSFSYQSSIGELGLLYIGLKGTGTIDWANAYSGGALVLQSGMRTPTVAIFPAQSDMTNATSGNTIPTTNPPVSAVPEPETYGMLLAGLGLLAGVARRRMQ